MDRTPAYLGPRFGVEAAEDGKFRPAIYDIFGKASTVSEKRLSYGDAFVEASKMAVQYG